MTASAPPKIYVMTPFYNSAAYLEKCISSVLAQTHREFRYLLIDNVSTDAGPEICRQFAARDERVTYIRKAEHLPRAISHNRAFRDVPRDAGYIKMIQADDWLYPRALEEMLAVAVPHPKVAMVGSLLLKGTKVHGDGLPVERTIISGREACRLHLLDGVFMFGSPSSLLYRADVVFDRPDFFHPTHPHPDTQMCYQTLRTNDFGFVHQVLTYLRQDDASYMGKVKRLGSQELDRLLTVKEFAADFLEPDERARVEKDAESRVYLRLAACALEQASGTKPAEAPGLQAMLEHMDNGLAVLGQRIDRAKLARYVAQFAAQRLAPPAALDAVRRVRQAM